MPKYNITTAVWWWGEETKVENTEKDTTQLVEEPMGVQWRKENGIVEEAQE